MLVGVPIKVEAPPIDAEYAIASKSGIAKSVSFEFVSFEKIVTTDNAIGNIIIVEAVLLTHILIKAVVIINPAIILLGLVPEKDKIFKAMRLCKPHDSIAEAIINPPRKSKTKGWAYELAIKFKSNILKIGNNIRGMTPVKYIGIASVTHHIVISKVIPAVNQAVLLKSFGGFVNIKINSINIPKTVPNRETFSLLIILFPLNSCWRFRRNI